MESKETLNKLKDWLDDLIKTGKKLNEDMRSVVEHAAQDDDASKVELWGRRYKENLNTVDTLILVREMINELEETNEAKK